MNCSQYLHHHYIFQFTELTHVLPQPFPEPVKEPHQEKGSYIILTRWACPTVEDTHTTNICPPPIIRAWLRNNEGRRPRPCQIKKVFTLGLANHAIQPGYIHHWLGHHHIYWFSMPVKNAQINLVLEQLWIMNTTTHTHTW